MNLSVVGCPPLGFAWNMLRPVLLLDCESCWPAGTHKAVFLVRSALVACS